MKRTQSIVSVFIAILIIIFYGCKTEKVEEINIGYIGPLSTRATDLGIGASNAIRLAIDQYNNNRKKNEPKVNLYIEDDKWDRKNALPAYNKLRKEHNIDILFISNTDGTVAVQDKIMEDKVIAINPLNNDELLSSLNKNTFKIAKSTEEASGLVAIRIIELGYEKVAIFHYPNDFMTRGANAIKKMLDENQIEVTMICPEKGSIEFEKELKSFQKENYDAYVFFGYKEFGHAMKQARYLGITAPFYGSTVLLDPEFYINSQGEIEGTEFPFFTSADGNYVLAEEFLTAYENKFGHPPYSVWPPMQAYDATNLVLSQVKTINESKKQEEFFDDWLRIALHQVDYHQGICGNISINKEGASRGIYFSLYKYMSKDKPFAKVKR